MTASENPSPRASPLPCLRPARVGTSLKPSLLTTQSVLPDIVSTSILPEHRSKKRVRFALKLKAVEEESSLSSCHENSVVLTTKPSKRVIDPWRENGPLYGAYIEYLAKKDVSTLEDVETDRPSTPANVGNNRPSTPKNFENNRPSTPKNVEKNRPLTPEPTIDSSTYTHTFLFQNKVPEIIVDSITVSPSSRHLPRILHRTRSTKKTNRKSPSPVPDHHLKQPVNIATPSRSTQSRKIPYSGNNKNQSNSIYPIVKRAEFTLPSLKTVNSNEKVTREDQSLGTKIVDEYFQSKKFTEIITNPLPGANNEINYISGHAILHNRPRTPQISYHNQINNEPYFFQNHNNDHFRPIIH